MNTRLLFIISLCVAMLAVWFYRSEDDLTTSTSLSASNIEYEATQVDAVQTDSNGMVNYLLTADEVVHYSDRNLDELNTLTIQWQPSSMRQIKLNAEYGQLNHNTGEVTMSQNVMFVSAPNVANLDQSIANRETTETQTTDVVPMQLSAQELIGNFNTRLIRSELPITVTQGNNQFESNSFNADLSVGEYEFEQVAVVFEPPVRQDVPLF